MKFEGNSSAFVSPGLIDDKEGIYTIMMNNETGIIYHRFFYETHRMHTFKLNGVPFFLYP